MRLTLENFMNMLIKRRILVLGILSGILLSSLGFGVWYQKKQEKEVEARIMFDEAWQKILIAANQLQQSSGQIINNDENTAQIQELFKQAFATIEELTLDYSETVSAARAGLLLISITSDQQLKNMIGLDENVVSEYLSDSYLSMVKRKHPKFWGAAVSLAEGLRFEQKGEFVQAISSYKEALKNDKKKYMNDYIFISLARNYEILNDIDNAVKYYQKIVDFHMDSLWANTAIVKLYLLSKYKSPQTQSEELSINTN